MMWTLIYVIARKQKNFVEMGRFEKAGVECEFLTALVRIYRKTSTSRLPFSLDFNGTKIIGREMRSKPI